MELKEIPNYTGYYVSNEGDVYSTLARGCQDRYDLDKRVPPKKMKPRKTKRGYCRVYLRNEVTNKREDLYIYRLVAQAFIPNPFNLPEVNHKDCNVSNNRVENLEWVTRKGNLDYAFEHGYMSRDELGRFCHK